MKADHDEKSATCRSCEKQRPATVAYEYMQGTEKRTEWVCTVCCDRLEIQREFGAELSKRFVLLHEDRYDEFFAWLDAFEASHRHRDHEGWLARTIASERQHELWWAERYEESMAAYEVVKQLGFEKGWQSWGSAECQALVLEALGRHDEALAAFEEAFRNQEPPNYVATSESMNQLVKFSANAGKPVDESWRDLIKAVAAHFRLEFPDRPTLAESIMALYEVTHKICNPQPTEIANE
jgi:tetratricopeptide (TPR) repeat protein